MSKKVIYKIKWVGDEIVESPRPTELSEEGADLILSKQNKNKPKWVEEKDLVKFGFSVEKSSKDVEQKRAQEAKTEPVVEQKKEPQPQEVKKAPFLKSVEQVTENK